MTVLAPILEAFFTDRLMTQRGASPHTIAPYRDTFTLLLGHIHQQVGVQEHHRVNRELRSRPVKPQDEKGSVPPSRRP